MEEIKVKIPKEILEHKLESLHDTPTIQKLLAIGLVMWEANGDISRFDDPFYMHPDTISFANSLLAYIITINESYVLR
jgi:hypothetical protein